MKSLTLGNNAQWLSVEGSGRMVEGKLHGPESGRQLIVFQPGFPGGAARDFENWHLPELLTDGRSIYTLRHNGTILDGKHSAYYLNCPERLEEAVKNKEHLLGGQKSVSLKDWLDEPITVLEALGHNYDEIMLVGHSFGCLSLAWSLITGPKALFAKTKKVVFLAGALGRIRSGELSDPVLEDWRHHLDCEWIRERVEIGPVDDNLKTLLEASTTIHREIGKYPHIETILLHPWGDTPDSLDVRIHLQESIDFLLSLNNGCLIVDKTQKPDAEKGAAVHDLPNLKTAFLNELLEPSFKPESRIMSYNG